MKRTDQKVRVSEYSYSRNDTLYTEDIFTCSGVGVINQDEEAWIGHMSTPEDIEQFFEIICSNTGTAEVSQIVVNGGSYLPDNSQAMRDSESNWRKSVEEAENRFVDSNIITKRIPPRYKSSLYVSPEGYNIQMEALK